LQKFLNEKKRENNPDSPIKKTVRWWLPRKRGNDICQKTVAAAVQEAAINQAVRDAAARNKAEVFPRSL
jgi:hypothetical protein